MVVKSYAFELMDSKMYVIREGDKAVVIDPNVNEEAFDYLSGVKELTILLTHEHFDHISGVNEFKNRFNCSVICSDTCNEIMSTKSFNTRAFPFLFLKDKEKYHYVREHYKLPYYCSATKTFSGTASVQVAGHDFDLYEMPGHSPGSSLIIMDGQYLFAGDNILGNGNEVVFHDSDKDYYSSKVLPFLGSLKSTDVKVFPGHGQEGSLCDYLKLISESKL